MSIEIAERGLWSDVVLWRSSAARPVAAALKRSGYEIFGLASDSLHARRLLHGSRELEAEICRLEALAADTSALKALPPRRPRSPGLSKGTGRFAHVDLRRVRNRHGWSLEWVSAGRKGSSALLDTSGWTVGAWCSAFDDGDDRRLETYVQVFSEFQSQGVDSQELARLTRSFRSHLKPLGYKATKINWGQQRPEFAVFEKNLPTLAAARRERSALDRKLFGD